MFISVAFEHSACCLANTDVKITSFQIKTVSTLTITESIYLSLPLTPPSFSSATSFGIQLHSCVKVLIPQVRLDENYPGKHMYMKSH